MKQPDIELKDFYREELRALREDAVEFGKNHQAVARELGLAGGRADDPHVELLLQSFAYLSGRLRYQIEADSAVIPNGLLEQLYPHLVSSVPSMAIMQLDIESATPNYANAPLLERGRQFEKNAINEKGETIRCHFRTTYDTPVWPLHIASVALAPTNQYDFLTARNDVFSVLRVQVRCTGKETIGTLPLDNLRLYLDAESEGGYEIYDLLGAHLQGIAVVIEVDSGTEKRQIAQLLDHRNDFRWCGYHDDEAMLPERMQTHPAYRLMQEYFAFPAKFMFFEVGGLKLEKAQSEFELLFLLNAAPKQKFNFSAETIRLNCVPAVNLFHHAIEPVRLDQRRYEYRLSADWARHRYCEIYQIENLYAMRKDGSVRDLAPYYSVDLPAQESDYFYAARKERSQPENLSGTETCVSFLDIELNMSLPADEMIGGRALCTNRQLPEHVQSGMRFKLEGNGPVNSAVLITKPTRHISPRLIGTQPWSLISQLSLNYLSLSDGPDSLRTLKGMLRLHIGSDSDISHKQIESIQRMACKSVVRNVTGKNVHGFCRGVGIDLHIKKSGFESRSALLFADVVRHFLVLFAQVNSFVQLSLYNEQNPGEVWKQWLPMAGNQTFL